MLVKSAEFQTSNEDYRKCPDHKLPEYAFIGRSNVGKSSLINMITNRRKLARISQTPGKTLLINHFLINDTWYLVDLPGYGFARQPKKMRDRLTRIIENYIIHRPQLTQLFILIDARHEAKTIDLNFINWAGSNGIPVALVITKADKPKKQQLKSNIETYRRQLTDTWSELPDIFVTSAVNAMGKEELLSHIEQVNKNIKKNYK